MSAPTANDIRLFLEGYEVTPTQLSDAWILGRMNNNVIPYIKRFTGQVFDGVSQIIEYHSGNDGTMLILNKRPVVALIKVELISFQNLSVNLGINTISVIPEEGILKAMGVFENYPFISMFPKGEKNLRVTYTYGFSDFPSDIREAIIYLTASRCLSFIGARTGGGEVSVQGHSRSYGSRGKFTDIINNLDRDALDILREYSTGVVGS